MVGRSEGTGNVISDYATSTDNNSMRYSEGTVILSGKTVGNLEHSRYSEMTNENTVESWCGAKSKIQDHGSGGRIVENKWDGYGAFGTPFA